MSTPFPFESYERHRITEAAERAVINAAKAWLTAIVVCDGNKNPSDDFGYAMDLERRQAELEKAVRALMEIGG